MKIVERSVETIPASGNERGCRRRLVKGAGFESIVGDKNNHLPLFLSQSLDDRCELSIQMMRSVPLLGP